MNSFASEKLNLLDALLSKVFPNGGSEHMSTVSLDVRRAGKRFCCNSRSLASDSIAMHVKRSRRSFSVSAVASQSSLANPLSLKIWSHSFSDMVPDPSVSISLKSILSRVMRCEYSACLSDS